MLFHKIKWRDGINHIEGINNMPRNVLNKLNDILLILVDGSKTENKLVLIFSLRT